LSYTRAERVHDTGSPIMSARLGGEVSSSGAHL